MARHRRSTRAVVAAALGLLLGAGGVAALAEPPKLPFSPDPPSKASRAQWTFAIASRGGKLTIDKVQASTLDKPAESPRVLGRFALELYVGKELLDRVRFDVPLLEAPPEQGPSRHSFKRRSRFENVNAKVSARMADNPRASYLVLVDRATGDTTRFDWPPKADGTLGLWKSGWWTEEDGGADFADGGVRVVETRKAGAHAETDGGAVDEGGTDAGRAARDAGTD